MHIQCVGLEHLQRGVEFRGNGGICFEKDGPTTFIVSSHEPFTMHWQKIDDDNHVQVLTLSSYADRTYESRYGRRAIWASRGAKTAAPPVPGGLSQVSVLGELEMKVKGEPTKTEQE